MIKILKLYLARRRFAAIRCGSPRSYLFGRHVGWLSRKCEYDRLFRYHMRNGRRLQQLGQTL